MRRCRRRRPRAQPRARRSRNAARAPRADALHAGIGCDRHDERAHRKRIPVEIAALEIGFARLQHRKCRERMRERIGIRRGFRDASCAVRGAQTLAIGARFRQLRRKRFEREERRIAREPALDIGDLGAKLRVGLFGRDVVGEIPQHGKRVAALLRLAIDRDPRIGRALLGRRPAHAVVREDADQHDERREQRPAEPAQRVSHGRSLIVSCASCRACA